MTGEPKIKQTKDGVQLQTDVIKTTMSVLLPNSTNTNTVNYLVNAIKKHIPQTSNGQQVAKDANVSKAEEAKKKREEQVK